MSDRGKLWSTTAAPMSGIPAPPPGRAHPSSVHPETTSPPSRVGLATAGEPDPATTGPLPPTRFPVSARWAGSAHFDPGGRRPNTDHHWSHSDRRGPDPDCWATDRDSSRPGPHDASRRGQCAQSQSQRRHEKQLFFLHGAIPFPCHATFCRLSVATSLFIRPVLYTTARGGDSIQIDFESYYGQQGRFRA